MTPLVQTSLASDASRGGKDQNSLLSAAVLNTSVCSVAKKYELFVIRYSILCSHKPTNITGDRMARLVQPHSELSHLLHQMQGALELASTEISNGKVMEKSWEKNIYN